MAVEEVKEIKLFTHCNFNRCNPFDDNKSECS